MQQSFDTSQITYSIRVRQVAGTEFKSQESVFSDWPSTYTDYNRHGVRLIFETEGTVGTFDFQTLLINLIAGAALVSLATVAVDLIALYVLPQKTTYREYMLEETPDLKEIQTTAGINDGDASTTPILSSSDNKSPYGEDDSA